MGSPYTGTIVWLLDEGSEELLGTVPELLGTTLELLGLPELLLGAMPEELGLSAVDELCPSMPPSSPEQERVNVMASPKAAASVIFESVLIVLPPFLWVKRAATGGCPYIKILKILKFCEFWFRQWVQWAATGGCPYGGVMRHFAPPPAARLLVRRDDDGGGA
jgi:hypothetical protein